MDQVTTSQATIPNPASPLYYLVDFDNLRRFSKGKTIEAIAKHIVAITPQTVLDRYSRVTFRMYGGWRSLRTPTPLAQQLTADIAATFPLPISRTNSKGQSVSLLVDATLANAPLFLPRTAIAETYVRGRTTRRLLIEPKPWFTCAMPATCSLTVVEQFLTSELCTNEACSVAPEDILRQDEQKQVDTLLVADIAHLTYAEKVVDIVVVSSDADIWPGILLTLSRGTQVVHVHTTPGTKTPPSQLAMIATLLSQYAVLSV